MDYQSLFEQDIYDDYGYKRPPNLGGSYQGRSGGAKGNKSTFYTQEEEAKPWMQPVHQLQFKHFEGRASVAIEDGTLIDEDINDSNINYHDAGEYARLRVMLSPPRIEAKDQSGDKATYNPATPIPFDKRTFCTFVDTFKFHKAILSPWQLGQVSKISGPRGTTSFYIETYSYRGGWYKVSVSYIPITMTTNVFIHNLDPNESHTITAKLLSSSFQPLTIHPMLLPTLIYKLLFTICHKELNRLFRSSISTEHNHGLTTNPIFQHFRDTEHDNKKAAKAAEISFGDGQSLCALEERMDFNIMLGRKLLSYFDELLSITPDVPHKQHFQIAGDIIKNRLEYLVSGLEFQMPRLRRAQAHTMLNRTGLENRVATQGNKINYQIALESKADSSAMKAIAVLTMFFLPATFLATFFAMPFFNWDAEMQNGVVKDRLWIYWAVTAPATLLVLGCWRVWWKFTNWNQHRDNRGENL